MTGRVTPVKIHSNISFFNAADFLEYSDGDSHRLCGKMQLVSRILKSDRYESHPERFIGCGIGVKDSNPALLNSADLIPLICANLPALASVAGHRHQRSFFNFFFLSLLLDILKAQKSAEESAVINSKCGGDGLFQSVNYVSLSSLVINILAEKVVSSNPEWLNSRCSCLKVKKIFADILAITRCSVWLDIYLYLYIHVCRENDKFVTKCTLSDSLGF